MHGGAAEAAKEPDVREGEDAHVRIGQEGHPVPAQIDSSGERGAEHAAVGGHALPDLNEAPGIRPENLRVIGEKIDPVRAEQAKEGTHGDETRNDMWIKPDLPRPPACDEPANDDAGPYQQPKRTEFMLADAQRR